MSTPPKSRLPTTPSRAKPPARRARGGEAANKIRRNRIYELSQQRGWTYADVAERAGVHELTITRLASGKIQLTQDWMEKLGEIYQVPATEIISAPPTKNLRRVRVEMTFAAERWRDNNSLAENEQYDVFVDDDDRFRALTLYAGHLSGNEMNARYADGSIIVLSKLLQRPNEIEEGRRYHVRVTRDADGLREDTIKTLTKDASGRYWLKPESSEPQFQAIPLDGGNGYTVELIGRVRFVVHRED